MCSRDWEPALQWVEPSLDPHGSVLRPTLGVLAYVAGVTACYVLGCYYFGCTSVPTQQRPGGAQIPGPDEADHREPIANPPTGS